MTKPTFMQSLLNQPSQSYSYKQNMDTNRQLQMAQQPPPPSSQQLKPPPPTAYRHRLSYNEFEDLEPSEDSDLEDLFFTPNTSPRTSMASSLLMFPTGRKPSRRSLRLSDSSDTVHLADVAASVSAAAAALGPSPSPVLSTRTPFSSSTQNRQHHPRHINTLSTASSTTSSLEPHSVHSGSVEPPIRHANTSHPVSLTAESDDKKQGKGGATTKRTRHGLVTIKPNPTTTTTQSESVKSTVTTSKRRNSQQGLADGDVNKDVVKRSTSSSSTPPVTAAASKRKSGQQGLVDGDMTKDVKRSVPSAAPTSATSNGSAVTVKITTTTATVEPPHDLTTSRKSSKSQTSVNQGPAAANSKEKMKQDVVGVETEKGKQVDSSTPSSSSKLRKDRGKEKETTKTTPAQTNLIPKTTPHTFSAFAPLPAAATPVPPADGSANDSSSSNNNKSSLPPAGFSFPPPPPHSPQQQQRQSQSQSQQQQKNPLNGSAAAYTYALRQKGNNSPKPGGAVGPGGGIFMNMAALLEEDEVDVEGDGSTPARRLRRMPNGGDGQRKGKEKKRISDSTSSRSDSSSHYSPPPSRSNANSHPTTSNSNTTVLSQSQQSQSHSDSSTFRSPPKTMTSEVNAMSLSTPGELPSKGTQGYNSLVLPRAPLPHSASIRSASTSGSGSRKWFGSVGKEGKIDLTRSGVAQTTMTSVEVIRGLGRQQGQNRLGGKLMGMLRRRSTSGGRLPRPIEGLGKPVDNDMKENNLPTKGKTPTVARVEGTVLGFTSYRKPPGYVPSSSVLVQVWAVGVDGVDGRLVGVNFGDHVWRERGVGGYEDEETGVETEWESEMRKGEESEEVDVSRSTPQQGSGLSGLGRSLSWKMSSRKKRGSIGPPRRQDNQQALGRRTPSIATTEQKPSRSFSLRRNNSVQSSAPQPPQQKILTKSSSQKQAQRQKMLQKATHRADVGYIPGRSFVGRVLECGWDVRDEEIRKGEWVVGLLDIKKCGALTEFIVVDRHRIHRVPHPRKSPHQQGNGNMGPEMPFQDDEKNLTLEELALLPLCGIPAYRAVRTFIYAFSSLGEGGSMALPITAAHDRNRNMNNSSKMMTTEHPQGRRRRVLVLRGHDGVGAMAVQLLAKRGWEVSVHVPFSASSATYDPTTTEAEHVDPFPMNIQERARKWGADEIIFDEEAGDGIDDGRIAAIRVMESLKEDGDVFDAILDTVGGKEVREAGERLLRSAGVATTTHSVYASRNEPPMSPRVRDNKAKGMGQFTTLVGDVPERPIPTAGDHMRAGLRSIGVESGAKNGGDEGMTADMRGNKVGYAWVSVAQDVDWEGEDISETLSSVLRLALEERVRPVIGALYRIVPFEQAPYVFVDKGPLGHGCNVVVKIAG